MTEEHNPLHRGVCHLICSLHHALPKLFFHHGAFEFQDDGEASRSLFDAVAEMTTLMPMVCELEARLAADARAASLDATQGPARS
jgi:hypothetical protein